MFRHSVSHWAFMDQEICVPHYLATGHNTCENDGTSKESFEIRFLTSWSQEVINREHKIPSFLFNIVHPNPMGEKEKRKKRKSALYQLRKFLPLLLVVVLLIFRFSHITFLLPTTHGYMKRQKGKSRGVGQGDQRMESNKQMLRCV